MNPTDALAQQYPTSVVRIWGSDAQTRSQVREAILSQCQAVQLEGEALAIIPQPGDPAVFDAGVHWSRRVLAGLEGTPDGPRILLSPAELLLRGSEVLGIHDDIALDVVAKPPQLAPNRAYLTTWAAQTLETPWTLKPSGAYRGPSGREVPLVRAGARMVSTAPWRNPGLLGRSIESTSRPELEGLLGDHLDDRIIRVSGPAGCGKSRLVWETLQRRARMFLWLQAQPKRRSGLTLVQQLADQLVQPGDDAGLDPLHPRLDPSRRKDFAALRHQDGLASIDFSLALLSATEPAAGPLYLVCDDFEQIQREDLDLLLELSNTRLPNRVLHLILVGRGGTPRSGFEGTFSLRVTPFTGPELDSVTERLFGGLSLPDALCSHLIDATRGHPFALEEGLISLVRSKVMRTLYGNFFFAGTVPATYQPSARLVSHIQAEAGRLGHGTRMTLLALADTPIPPDILTVAAGHLDTERTDAWATAALEAGMLHRVPSPWGIGVEFSCPAYARALALSAPEETRIELRARLGRALQPVSGQGEQHWFVYRLLEGGADASAALLRTAHSAFASNLDSAVLFDALTKELERHREAGGEDETELLLIWRLLPTARRLGKLQHCIPEVERACELTAGDANKQLALASLKASAYEEAGHHRKAEEILLAALQTTPQSDQPKRRGRLALQLAAIYEKAGRLEQASRLLQELYPALESRDLKELAASCHFTLGEIALQRNRLEEAITHHRAAYEARRSLGGNRAVTTSLAALGRVAHAAGNYPQALDYFDRAVKEVEDKESEECAGVLLGTARVLGRLGDHQHAATLNRRALAIYEKREDAAAEAGARLALAETLFELAQNERALAEARQVHFKMDLLSMPAGLAEADRLIGRIELSHRKYELARAHLERALAKHTEQANARGAALDHCWLIELGLAKEDGAALRRHTAGLSELLTELQHSSVVESLSYRMFRGLSWLRLHDARVEDPLPHLESAYREVLRKARPLDPERRHQFLFEVPDNRAIVDFATRQGLEAPDA
jgi:tetratricopeptide (TPR) repeat protein